MSFEIKPSSRQGIIPLFCLWGGTGGGKTESALRLARGLAGPKGRVVVIDTEGKRSGYYSDRIPGGFLRLDFDEPFTPERYVEAMDLAEKSADAVVLDSASHSWSGPDGVLDLHEQALDKMTKGSTDWAARERLNWPAWREPKMRFKHMTNRILAFKIPLVVCFRGEEKTHMEKENGRNTVVTDKTTSPIFDKKFIFEAHVALECIQKNGEGGFVRYPMPYAKTSHADIRALLPKPEIEQLSVAHGEALARWCSAPTGPGVPATATTPVAAPVAGLADAGTRQRMIARFAGSEQQALGYAIDQGWLMPNETLDEFPLKHVPTTLKGITSLIQAIEGWAGK
jgi:hypothetical protein